MKVRNLASWVLAAVLVVAGQVQAAEKMDIVETAVSAGSFKTLAAALEAADLVKALQGEGPFTVFAPTDEAFAKLPKGTVESLLKPENRAALVGRTDLPRGAWSGDGGGCGQGEGGDDAERATR
ncbi:MAG: fasciclin domain-containing protein [Planctomycetaceae bacterium]